jgi:hypothetical protein
MATTTALAATTSPSTAVNALATPVITLVSYLVSKTHPPKPYDIVQGMACVIDMMEETLRICKRAQRSTQQVSMNFWNKQDLSMNSQNKQDFSMNFWN